MNDKDLKSLQTIELKILSVFDDFCKKHEIPYSLYAGTALGAVRHRGFIPWDDDVDIAMTRENLNRLILAWKKNPLPGYYLETCLDDPYCGTSHVKLRKDDTILLSKGEDETKGHHGIWLDIFPLDKVQTGMHTWNMYFHGILLNVMTRANVSMSNDPLKKKILRKILRLIPFSFRKKLIHYSWQWFTTNSAKITDDYSWMSTSAVYAFSLRFPQSIVDDYIFITFAGREFSIFKDYHTMLTNTYGDYMKLPPVEKQVCTHNPIQFQISKDTTRQ